MHQDLLQLLVALDGVARSPRYHPEGNALYHLEGLLSPRVVWLVRHHLDLLREPRRTRRKHRGTRELHDLERLRRWDLGGRRRDAWVSSAEDAIALLFDGREDDSPLAQHEHGRNVDRV